MATIHSRGIWMLSEGGEPITWVKVEGHQSLGDFTPKTTLEWYPKHHCFGGLTSIYPHFDTILRDF